MRHVSINWTVDSLRAGNEFKKNVLCMYLTTEVCLEASFRRELACLLHLFKSLSGVCVLTAKVAHNNAEN